MTAIDDILGKLDMDQLAAQLGTDPDSVRQASTEAISSLMGGLQQNSAGPAGARSLASALKDHSASNLLGDMKIDLNKIDPNDGEKIVQHALGARPDQAAQFIGGRSDKGLLQRLLPILAPIVLAYLGSKLGNRQIEAGRGQQAQQTGGSILDILLGQGGQQQGRRPSADYQQGYEDGYNAARAEAQQTGGMGLSDILGGMMGQQPRQQQQQGGLGGLLGGLFG